MSNEHVHPVFQSLFEGFRQTFESGKQVFPSVTEMYQWLNDKPGFTGNLEVVFSAAYNLDGVTHRVIEFEVSNYDASKSETVKRLDEHPAPYPRTAS